MAGVRLLQSTDMSSFTTSGSGGVSSGPNEVDLGFSDNSSIYLYGEFTSGPGVVTEVIIDTFDALFAPNVNITGLSFNMTDDDAIGLAAGDLAQFVSDLLSGDDTVLGSSGNDTILGFAGNDLLIGGGGDNLFGGGSGSDTVSYASAAAGLSARIENAGANTGEAAGDTYDSVENLIGSAFNDVLSGNGVGNVLTGGFGNDQLFGRDGDDTLLGNNQNDRLIGGLGRDVMTGGAGLDDFDFDTVAEIGKNSARDVIKDFVHLSDDIDLSTIDANGGAAGNTAFSFRASEGASFTGVRGQLRWFQQDLAGTVQDSTIIEGDTNGDAVADFQIALTGLKALTATDFFL